jgi:hypothetical protein
MELDFNMIDKVKFDEYYRFGLDLMNLKGDNNEYKDMNDEDLILGLIILNRVIEDVKDGYLEDKIEYINDNEYLELSNNLRIINKISIKRIIGKICKVKENYDELIIQKWNELKYKLNRE